MTLTKLLLMIGGIAVVITAIRYFVQKPLSLPVAFVQSFVGVFFIFSGAVKAIDPLGTSFKIEDYFIEFKTAFLEPFTLTISVIMIVLEIVVGVTLLLGYLKNLTLVILVGLILFFTFLTGYTAKTLHVTDCGCFGDFLKLEPSVSFAKDVFLSVLILFLVLQRKYIEPLFSKMVSGPITALALVGVTLFCFRNFAWNEPIVDFRPYKIGNYIPDQMKGIADKKEYTWVYKDKATGEVKEFSDAEFGKISSEPDFKSKWEYVDRKDKILVKGIAPKIASFNILADNGDDLGEDILYNPDYQFLVIIYSLDETCTEAFKQLNTIAEGADKDHIAFFAVSNGTAEQKEAFRHEYQTAYPFYTGDDKFLKAMIRSNPGLLLIKDGKVIGKWHHHHFPTYEELKRDYLK